MSLCYGFPKRAGSLSSTTRGGARRAPTLWYCSLSQTGQWAVNLRLFLHPPPLPIHTRAETHVELTLQFSATALGDGAASLWPNSRGLTSQQRPRLVSIPCLVSSQSTLTLPSTPPGVCSWPDNWCRQSLPCLSGLPGLYNLSQACTTWLPGLERQGLLLLASALTHSLAPST